MLMCVLREQSVPEPDRDGKRQANPKVVMGTSRASRINVCINEHSVRFYQVTLMPIISNSPVALIPPNWLPLSHADLHSFVSNFFLPQSCLPSILTSMLLITQSGMRSSAGIVRLPFLWARQPKLYDEGTEGRCLETRRGEGDSDY